MIIYSLFLEDNILSKYNFLSNIWSFATKKNISYRQLCTVYNSIYMHAMLIRSRKLLKSLGNLVLQSKNYKLDFKIFELRRHS